LDYHIDTSFCAILLIEKSSAMTLSSCLHL